MNIKHILLISFLVFGCSRGQLIISSYGHRGEVEFGAGNNKNFSVKERVRKWGMNEVARPKIKKNLKVANPKNQKISNFKIITTTKFLDGLYCLIPFYNSRTIIYSGIIDY